MFLALIVAAQGQTVPQEFVTYPGAMYDEKMSKLVVKRQADIQVFTTPEAFDKVRAFYATRFHEVKFNAPAPTVRSGVRVRWAFFTLDYESDLAHSKYWIKVQYPFIASVNDDGEFTDIRDVTAIQTFHVKARAGK